MSSQRDGGRRLVAGAQAPRVLVVDDEADIRELLELTLVRMGLDVDQAAGVAEARARLAERDYDLCLTDMRMEDGDGLDLVRFISESRADTPVAVITAFGSADNAVAALKAGAFDYLSKPVALDQLRALVRSAIDVPGRTVSPQSLPEPRALIGESPALADARALIDRVARNMAPVLVSGESGSGKELAARRIHALSGRGGAFVAVNCGAIPEQLMESEFFGYRKGAFTGADEDRGGFFQAAQGGTLFLDEIAELPLSMQVKLLRAIQERQVRRVGSVAEEAVDVRIVSATHQNLGAMVAAGRFRQDLLYRLNVVEIRMPSLREFRDDIPMLARSILDRVSMQNGRTARLSDAAIRELLSYDFPGNVRELENVIERALALSSGECIDAADLRLVPAGADLPARQGAGGGAPVDVSRVAMGLPLQDYLDHLEREAILAALAETGDNRTAAAKLLGVTFRSLRYRLQRLNIAERGG
ncbi:MAG: sigma-54-dependent Fis family transcriptional regulator [Burkholderiales bacterium]|nr:sigma-54-dependent Fis family transcriptional regulator [Burkholderiales bacterium]